MVGSVYACIDSAMLELQPGWTRLSRPVSRLGSTASLLGAPRIAAPANALGSSIIEAEFLKGLHIKEVELELGQRLRRESIDSAFDLSRQRAELFAHL